MSAALALLCACGQEPENYDQVAALASPNGQINVSLVLSAQGSLKYSVDYGDTPVVLPSLLGFDMRGTVKSEDFKYGTDDVTKRDSRPGFSMHDGFEVVNCTSSSFDETWEPVWGEESEIRNHYNELLVELRQKESGRLMNVRFRAFDDGVGFRYEFPDGQPLVYFVIKEELTEFAMASDNTAWWIPGDYDTQEYEYTRCRLS